MNPYLRVKQSVRPTAYLYAEHILQGDWPEMEPTSNTKPLIHIKILRESPIGGVKNRPYAEAIIGIFFGDELISEHSAQKWLRVIDHIFEYTISPAAGARGAIDFSGAPHLYINSTMNNALGDVYPWIEYGIQDALNNVYKNWHPKPPTRLGDQVKGLLLEAFGYPPKNDISITCETSATEVEVIPIPGDRVRSIAAPNQTGIVMDPTLDPTPETFYGREDERNHIYVKWKTDGTQAWVHRQDVTLLPPTIVISYAVWRDGGIFRGKGFPVFAVTGVPSTLYFTAGHAVKAAYKICQQTSSNIVVLEKVEELLAQVRDTLMSLAEEEEEEG